ncbi:Biofilm growth-associated repressor [Planctopirus ephydatiae]|uniref:Biofilm growth-associated repressor n=1 Tax=Planctopirus ephydatiae TaxID=2528019 RepID=A0A518GKP6_9PLAN|nr:metalloregulator ArsR/SmtB family transcription factor [Planctopirus ephydatiae]QDV29223.1 Biofilm growth-associated repressor [Planctopirus ephydatiae]
MSFSLPNEGAPRPLWTNPEVFDRIAERLRILAHPHRLRMVEMLLAGKYSVGELAESCSIPSHMASEHLRLMQHCGLLGSEKEGRYTYYRIAEPNLQRLLSCLKDQHLGMDEPGMVTHNSEPVASVSVESETRAATSDLQYPEDMVESHPLS